MLPSHWCTEGRGGVQSVGGTIKSCSAVIGHLCFSVAVGEALLWGKLVNNYVNNPVQKVYLTAFSIRCVEI